MTKQFTRSINKGIDDMEKKLIMVVKKSEGKSASSVDNLEKKMLASTEERIKKAVKKTDKKVATLEKEVPRMI